MSDELEVRVAKALFRFEQCDREQAKDVDWGWIRRLDNQDRAEYLGMAREAIHEVHVDAAQAVAIEREATSAFLERVADYATHPMIGEGGEWRRVVSDIELRAIAQAIRNGEHVKP